MSFRLPFVPADILIPESDHHKWASIACDQFTSEPEYWEKAYEEVADAPSCLKITLPEVYLNDENVDERISEINRNMVEYLKSGILREYKDALILVERTISDGRVRRGIVGAFELDAYSYEPDSTPLIRTTEGTVLSRIPPRVKIRKDASLELPHVMILADDKQRTVIEQIDTTGLEVVYDFDLMLDGGHLKGYLLPKSEQERIFAALSALAYGIGDDIMLFAVGDGNHSLATAKTCAPIIGTEQAKYALAELVNIHDDALDFEPIYRVMFGVDPDDVISEMKKVFAGATEKKVEYFTASEEGSFFVDGLESKVLQDFIDEYVKTHKGSEVDYIHGEDSLKQLAAKENAIGFIFSGINKDELFPYIRKNGPLPRKTFSMGEARDKRYYMEARKLF